MPGGDVRALDDATAPGVGTSAGDVSAPTSGVSADDVTAPTPAPAVRRAHDDATDVAVGPFRLGYRPQLDGVRGIAVLLVLTYHIGAVLWPDARFWLAPGGVLGLDVFFVLNIALSVAVLMAAMNSEKPLDFSSFPSVLLFATLLRYELRREALACPSSPERLVFALGDSDLAPRALTLAQGHVLVTGPPRRSRMST